MNNMIDEDVSAQIVATTKDLVDDIFKRVRGLLVEDVAMDLEVLFIESALYSGTVDFFLNKTTVDVLRIVQHLKGKNIQKPLKQLYDALVFLGFKSYGIHIYKDIVMVIYYNPAFLKYWTTDFKSFIYYEKSDFWDEDLLGPVGRDDKRVYKG